MHLEGHAVVSQDRWRQIREDLLLIREAVHNKVLGLVRWICTIAPRQI